MEITSASQGRAIWKSGRSLPCGCRVRGARQPGALVSCDEARRLEAELEKAARPLMYMTVTDEQRAKHRVALEALWAHREQTPVYLGGK